MPTITIPKKEYNSLLEVKLRYDHLRQIMEEDIFSPPPTRKSNVIVRAFKEKGHYSSEFLASLKQGLKRSSYFQS